MSDELKLKPCPFCGCSDVSMYTNGLDVDDYSYVVECDGCGCTLDTGFDSEERAIEEWNRRKEPERKTGKWIDGMPYVNSHWWVCSVCHVSAPENHTGYNFCPNCGAEMTR